MAGWRSGEPDRTNEILTDCERACDRESFVLGSVRSVSRPQITDDIHVAGPMAQRDHIVVYPAVIGIVVVQVLHFDGIRS